MARTRRFLASGCLALVALLLAGCLDGQYPNTIFNNTSDFNAESNELFDRMFLLGTLVFVGVEAVLIYIVVKFRRREGQQEPRHVHGNTTLEILWTAIPAVILVFLAVPTVRSIFRTQARAVPDALQVEVIGHQWWWEFRYPQYTRTLPNGRLDTLVTANELYLPVGRTANFALKTADVLHSFWIPRLAGTRDLIANHTNYLWFTPVDSMAEVALNGICKEYCGASHANMRFRVFTVAPAQFDSWVQGQLQLAAITGMPGQPPAAAPVAGTPAGGAIAAGTPATAAQVAQTTATPPGGTPATATQAATGTALATAVPVPREPMAGPGDPPPSTTGAQAPTGGLAPGYVFPREKYPQYLVPSTPVPTDIAFDDNLIAAGDAQRGSMAFLQGGCVGCHAVAGNPVAVGRVGPDLTHIASRFTLAGAQFPNTPAYMARWIKNAKKMKPGSLMPTLGKGEVDPLTGATQNFGLTDQQIADLVVYLQALK